jgi:hypothetical protein
LTDQIVKLSNLIIDFVKAAAWPAVVVSIAWYLRAELKGAAARIIKISPWSAELVPPTPQQQVAPSPSAMLPKIEGTANITEEPDRAAGVGTVSDSRSASSVELYVAQLKALVSEQELAPAPAARLLS